MKYFVPRITVELAAKGEKQPYRAAYEHPLPIRLCHWLNTVALFVLVTSGLRIFMAFPSFGPRLPETTLVNIPEALTLGGWLAGALEWHVTFAWIYAGTGVVYLGYQVLSGRYRQVLFGVRDLAAAWPVVRHYLFLGPRPRAVEPYNPLQKIAYTFAILLGAASVWTGLVLYNPVQFSLLASLAGGFHLARVWHFSILCLFVLFIAGHLVMVALHGWNNFYSMLTGWKKDPEYLR